MIHGLEHVLGEKGFVCLVVIVGGLLALAMLISVSHWVIRAGAAMQSDAVRRRAVELRRLAVELRRLAVEQRIAEIGEETRAAIQATAERRRREGSAPGQRD
jgi:hypothetical protein